jgi:hypothetical protein
MASKQSSSGGGKGRVLRFRHRRSDDVSTSSSSSSPLPTDDLGKYERGDDGDDYRHRMMMNVAAFVFVAALIGVGLWLADTMAQMRKNQDCVLSGRRGCAPVELNRDRW